MKKKIGKTGLEQIKKILKKLDRAFPICIECKKNVGFHQVKDGYMCDDCYYDALGEEIEKHPIASPRKFGK